ncbi:MAG TPA: NADH-quinone oxidoreductase subunit J [Candidatus Limnocylindrales bacterium]|nr:NADH-quinone oxidoreductase subunit J [Candidatus Limnocylindrales bacterium]
MRAWLYLIAAAIAGGIVATPAILVFVLFGGTFDDALFAALATLLIVSAIAVVTMRDIIRCGLAMIVSFLALAGIYVILRAPIVAATQVLVYIGAISVLILFAIMLTQEKVAPTKLVFQTQAVPGAVAAIIIALLVSITALGTDWKASADRVRAATEQVASLLFSSYVLPFEVVSVLLLAAVVGGVFIAKKERRPEPGSDI